MINRDPELLHSQFVAKNFDQQIETIVPSILSQLHSAILKGKLGSIGIPSQTVAGRQGEIIQFGVKTHGLLVQLKDSPGNFQLFNQEGEYIEALRSGRRFGNIG